MLMPAEPQHLCVFGDERDVDRLDDLTSARGGRLIESAWTDLRKLRRSFLHFRDQVAVHDHFEWT